jgi:transposase-like protein
MANTKKDNLKKKFIETYSKKACNISETCRKIGMHRDTYYKWRNDDEEFRKACEEAEESLIDFAETQIMKNIKDGKETSLIFFLKCKGKKRGYVEKQEIQHSGSIEFKAEDLEKFLKSD